MQVVQDGSHRNHAVVVVVGIAAFVFRFQQAVHVIPCLVPDFVEFDLRRPLLCIRQIAAGGDVAVDAPGQPHRAAAVFDRQLARVHSCVQVCLGEPGAVRQVGQDGVGDAVRQRGSRQKTGNAAAVVCRAEGFPVSLEPGAGKVDDGLAGRRGVVGQDSLAKMRRLVVRYHPVSDGLQLRALRFGGRGQPAKRLPLQGVQRVLQRVARGRAAAGRGLAGAGNKYQHPRRGRGIAQHGALDILDVAPRQVIRHRAGPGPDVAAQVLGVLDDEGHGLPGLGGHRLRRALAEYHVDTAIRHYASSLSISADTIASVIMSAVGALRSTGTT